MNSKVTEYILIQGQYHSSFVADVNRYIKQGWQPVGGVGLGLKYFYQAMVKCEEVGDE